MRFKLSLFVYTNHESVLKYTNDKVDIYMVDRIEELKRKIRFYEEQIGEDEGDSFEEYDAELMEAIAELNKLLEEKEK